MQKKAHSTRHAVSKVEYAIFFGMIALFATFSVPSIGIINFHSARESVNFFLSILTLSFTILLWFFCINSFAFNRREKQIFECMVCIFFLTVLTLLPASASIGKASMSRLSMLLNTLLYLFSALYWILFHLFQKQKYHHLFGDRVCTMFYIVFFGAYAVITLINHFTGFCFSVDENGQFVTHSFLLFNLTFLWFVIYLVLAMTTKCDLKTKLTLSSYSLFPMLNWGIAFIFPETEFYLDIFSAFGVFLYLIPLYLLFFNVYLESGRLYLQREHELEQSRANAMMLKISPHFIANTMSSIVALCDADAEKARDLASKFAKYLRDNYTDLTEDQMIPFSKELEHIRNYLAVEQIRFAGLKIEYDVKKDDFLLPVLTVQPLVENAVHHGISKRPDASGTLTIQSFEDENGYVIRIIDDGVGFSEPTNDKRRHVGIANAKARLALLCSGTLTVGRQVTGGTLCEIKIPKGEHYDSNLR